MTTITCSLECNHSIEWGDTPETPGADLPFEGRTVYCPECEADRTVEECDPSTLSIRNITLSGRPPTNERQPQPGDLAAILWDTRTGTYGYCFHGIGPTGLAYESDDYTGFDSPEVAEHEARGEYAERNTA
ncbi:MAG: hypothetical protein C4534_02085 [Gaiellales bacterium]|nr:MAG: hypothetical protein C4534_02085 [Gaiellales bacterium]